MMPGRERERARDAHENAGVFFTPVRRVSLAVRKREKERCDTWHAPLTGYSDRVYEDCNFVCCIRSECGAGIGRHIVVSRSNGIM